jgi:hypothetical protein
MLKKIIGIVALVIGVLAVTIIIMIVTVCLLATSVLSSIQARERAESAKLVDAQLSKIDVHFNAKLTALTPNLSTDTIFPKQVSKFMRESTQSGSFKYGCDPRAHYEEATYTTLQGTTIQISYCLEHIWELV